jgi:hypothetical protein
MGKCVVGDAAASLCFVIYHKAKEENLRGTSVQLTITWENRREAYVPQVLGPSD